MEARYCGCSPLDLDRVYAPDLQKTFFCYGGSDTAGKTLYHEVVYYDHRTGEVSRRTIVLDKHTPDAHDNPALQIDRDGYLWLFSNAHGRGRPSFIHRSARPYDITRFENVHPVKEEDGREAPLNNFSYLLAFYDPACGFLALFTHYTLPAMHSGKKDCRVAAFMTSPDGVHWSAWQDIANIAQGHYQSGGMWGKRIGTAFNYHPDRKLGAGLDYRANLYYVYTDDFGKRWRNAAGKALSLPQRRIDNPASEGWKVYINDLNYDRDGQPVILYELSRGWEPGPQNGPRRWYTARWTGSRWEILPITSSDHNYDLGSLYIEEDGTWRIIAPTSDRSPATRAGKSCSGRASTRDGTGHGSGTWCPAAGGTMLIRGVPCMPIPVFMLSGPTGTGGAPRHRPCIFRTGKDGSSGCPGICSRTASAPPSGRPERAGSPCLQAMA